MKVNLLLFGITRDIVGQSQLVMNYDGPDNIDSFKEMLVVKYPKMKELAHFKIAVNHEFAHSGQRIKEGDEVAIIPPVSGG